MLRKFFICLFLKTQFLNVPIKLSKNDQVCRKLAEIHKANEAFCSVLRKAPIHFTFEKGDSEHSQRGTTLKIL